MLPFLHIPFWPHTIPTFGLMLWLAAVAAAILLDRAFKRERLSADAAGMVAIAVIAGIVGAKLWHVIDTPSEFRLMGWSVLWDTAGFAWFGGVVFGLAALMIQGAQAKIGALRLLDLASPAAAIGYGIGRIGCFLAGDGCYGVETKMPWGMAFPHGVDPTPPGVRVQPTPLFEFGAGLAIGIWLWFRSKSKRPTGAILGEYFLLSGLARFLVEFIRRNPKVLWVFSNAQLAGLFCFLVGVAMLVWSSRRSAATTAA